MHEADPHAANLDQMRLAHALVRVEAVAMPVETFIAIAERRDNGCDAGQFVEHAIHVDVAGVHHEVDPRKHLENPCGEMLAGFGYMRVRDQTDSHGDLLRATAPAEHES
jgi:hypothetical protein